MCILEPLSLVGALLSGPVSRAGTCHGSHGSAWEKILHQVSQMQHLHSCSEGATERAKGAVCYHSTSSLCYRECQNLPSVLRFSFQKLLPSTERELRVCAGIHFEKVIWRIAWELESLWELPSLGQSFLGSQKCSCITAHRSCSRCSGIVIQRVATAIRADVCCKLHLIQHDEHRHTVQLMHR